MKGNLNILIISAHAPIDFELTDSWIKEGHSVSLITRHFRWSDQFSALNQQVSLGIPKHKPDVIVCEAIRDLRLAVAIKYSRLWFGTKIIKIHYWYPYKSIFLRWVENISVCEYSRKILLETQKLDSKVVYCPVDTEFFRPITIKKKKKAIAIGNGFKTRNMMGYDHLIKILHGVHGLDPEIELSVFGLNEKSDYPDFVDVRSVSREEMLKEVNSSSCIFFTTTYNLIMHSMEIAMSCGANVVAFELEPFKEVIEEGKSGYLIKNFDDDAFARKVAEVASTPDESVGKMARENIVSKCDRRSVARKILEK